MDMSARWYSPTESSGIRPLQQLKERTMYEVACSVRKWRQRVAYGMVSMVDNASRMVCFRWWPMRRREYGVDGGQRIAQGIVSMVANASQGAWGRQWPIASHKVWYGVQRVAQGMVSVIVNASQRYGVDGGQCVAQGMVPMVAYASYKVWFRWWPTRRLRYGVDGGQRVA